MFLASASCSTYSLENLHDSIRYSCNERTVDDRAVPVLTPATVPDGEGALRRDLTIQRCESCTQHYFYPRPFGPFCNSDDVTWTSIGGRGRLVPYAINYRPIPPFDSDTHAGAPRPPKTKRAIIDWFGQVVWEYLGSTKGRVSTCSTAERLEHPGTVGRPKPGTVKLRTLNREQSTLRKEGTIDFKTAPFEYSGDAENTASARWGEFATSGDVGRLDDDGYPYVLDRRGDLILTGGANVYPADLEGALLEHPGVADVGVIVVAESNWVQRVVAVIELASGFNGDEDLRTELDRHVHEQIADFKRPREYIFTQNFPRSAAGKISRQRLRRLVNGQH